MNALLRGQELRQESLQRWLHGEEVSPEDMRDLRSIGVTEKITKNSAFKILRSLCQTLRSLGYTSLALLFDEGDRMLSIGGKAEKTPPITCAKSLIGVEKNCPAHSSCMQRPLISCIRSYAVGRQRRGAACCAPTKTPSSA